MFYLLLSHQKWIEAIKNLNHATFPGITTLLVNQHLSSEMPTAQGYQRQRRYGIRSVTTRAITVTVALEPSVYETCSKVVELPHLACTC